MFKFSHDGRMPNPPGGGSSVFNKEYVNYLANYLPKKEVRISVGTRPNSSPHFGTITTFTLSFSLAQRLKKLGKEVIVMVGMVDTGTSEESKIENISYQKSLAYTGAINHYMNDFQGLLESLSSHFGKIDYQIVNQSDFGLHKKISTIVEKIVQEREKIGSLLFPTTNCLGLRVACPQCGLADRYGLKNRYEDNCNLISFFCPRHSWHSIDMKDSLQKLEYETPLRNLIRGWLYTQDNQDQKVPYSWLRVTGSDHAGFYQEQLFYRGTTMLGVDIANSPMIVYSPLVLDWSGVKLSKSILVEGGYDYLTEQGLDYLINYRKLKTRFGQGGLGLIFSEVDLWLEEPHRLFRSYTIFYFAELFKEKREEMEEREVGEIVNSLEMTMEVPPKDNN